MSADRMPYPPLVASPDVPDLARANVTTPRESPFRAVRFRERPRLRNAQRTIVLLGVLVVAAVVVTAVTTRVMAASRIDGTSVVALDREPEETRNIVVGLADSSDGPIDGVMVLQVSELRPTPAVLVLPVGLEVNVTDRGPQTLAAISDGGTMALVVEEVADYTGLDIHHYVRVDRTALAAAIDANGGILDCPTPDTIACPNVLGSDVLSWLAPPEGAVTGPERVVALARVAAIVGEEVARPSTVLLPPKALRWAQAWQDVLRTDHDPGPGGARELARLLAEFDPESLQVRVLPGLVDEGRITVTPETAAVLLDAFAQVGPMPADVGTEAPRELVPEDVTVQVLNGVGRPGLAGDMAEFLTDRGFLVVEVDNAPRFDPRAPTTIGYVDEQDRLLAELVASFLPGAELRELISAPPPGVDIVVTVGAPEDG